MGSSTPEPRDSSTEPDGRISFPAQLRRFVAAEPDRPAVSEWVDGVEHRTVSRAELDREADALADELGDTGVDVGAMVTIALPNGIAFMRALVACWKLGAIPQPVSPRLPAGELAAIIDLAQPAALIGASHPHVPSAATFAADWSAPPPGGGIVIPGERADAVSPSWKAPTSGGSTGRPKLIVSGDPALIDPEERPILRIQRDGTLVMPGPLYHNGPLSWSALSLLAGGHVVVLDRFDAATTLAAIERHRADMVYLVPTMMKRIARLPDEVREGADLSSLRTVWHLAEPCPEWLKVAWIEWLGAERIYELYAGTENQASTVIRGDEWLRHRGSVGRPVVGEIAIFRDDGTPAAAGEAGEVFLRRGAGAAASYRYVGAEPTTLEGGWESLGDVGHIDAEGYLHLGDRRSDMILRGGANIYPAEVEAAINEHADVESVAVIGLPDDDVGNRVHAIVQLRQRDGVPTDGTVSGIAETDRIRTDLDGHCRERLVAYKVPATWEFVDTPLRDDAGKVRRSALRAERTLTPHITTT